jgi:hypothetical protein
MQKPEQLLLGGDCLEPRQECKSSHRGAGSISVCNLTHCHRKLHSRPDTARAAGPSDRAAVRQPACKASLSSLAPCGNKACCQGKYGERHA